MWINILRGLAVNVFSSGQFICGDKKCNERQGLRSWEVNFAYMEDAQKKNALVKLSRYFEFMWSFTFAFHIVIKLFDNDMSSNTLTKVMQCILPLTIS